MKLTKKILSLVLAAALLLGTVAIAAQAEGLTDLAGSVQTFVITSDKTDENGVTNVKPGETIKIQVYMSTNYYTGSTGGDFFLWTAGVFEELGSNFAAKNFVATFTPSYANPANTKAYPTGYGADDYVGFQNTRINNSGVTKAQVVDNELIYEFNLTVLNDESLIDTKAYFEIPAGSVRSASNTRKGLVYQCISKSSTSLDDGSIYAETVNLDAAKLEINIVSAAPAIEYCDYAALETAVAKTPAMAKEYYDATEYASWERAVAAGNELLAAEKLEKTDENQKTINDAAALVESTFAALDARVVDLTKLNNAVTASSAVDPADKAYYVAADYEAWEAALAEAKAAQISYAGKPATAQATVDALADTLTAAYAKLTAAYLSLAKLNAAVAAYAAIDPADKDYYVAADYEAWEIALAEAKAAQTDYNETMPATKQAEVDAYADALEAAYKKLAADYVDLEKLNKAVADYAAPAYTAEYYDATAWSNWEAALAEAKAAQTTYATAPVTAQATVDGIADALEAAFEALVPSIVDLTDLNQAIAESSTPAYAAEYYDAVKYGAWQNALEAATTGVTTYTGAANTAENQAAVAALAKDLTDAFAALVPAFVDLTELEIAIRDNHDPMFEPEWFDADEYAAFEAALAAAHEGITTYEGKADTEANRVAVAKLAADLIAAYNELDARAVDVSDLKAAIAESVPAYGAEYYDAAAYKAFEDAVAAGTAIVDEMDGGAAPDTAENRATVADAAEAIRNAYAKLVPSFVSYEKVEKALADYSTAPNPEIYYTPDSWEAYEAALAAANDANENRPQPLPAATEANQAAVDKFATDLEAAYKGLTPAGGCSIISVTSLQADYVKGDVINFEVLCEGTGFSKIQFITESGSTSTYHRTHSSVKDIYVNEEGNEVWVIAQKVPSNVDVTRYAKAKMGKNWDNGVVSFQFVPTKEDASVKSVEILLGDEAVTEFLNTDTVTIKIVTGPATRRIRLVNPVTGSTSTYSTYTSANTDGTKVWTITRKYTTVKDYAFDIHTANSANILVDSGADLTFTVNKYVAPQVPSTGNVDDAVIAAAVAKARILKGSTQTFTITTDKAAKQVRIVNSYGNTVYRTAEFVSDDGTTKTWVITSDAYNTLGTYNYTVEALYGETWLADADGALTFKVLY